MVNKIKEIASKVWNILNGKDTDMDGDVDIDDAMLRAERKAKSTKKSTQEKQMSFKVINVEAACGTSVGAASTFNDSNEVRLVNSGSTMRLVTVANAADTTMGSFTLAPGEVTFIRKNPTDQVFAAHAEILGLGIVYQ